MARRLGCLSIPDFPMQIFLFERPEWKDEAVVLLDRDEANGRILSTNEKAAALGLGPGLMFGPCLGIHRSLKGGVADEGRLQDWSQRIEEILFRYSPAVEAAGFQEGLWWLDGRGLGGLYPSVRPWLSEVRDAVAALGFDCRAAAGSGRFSTWAAARSSNGRELRIFPDRETEAAWFDKVPVSLFSPKADTLTLLGRLKISTAGELLKVPVSEIRRRLDGQTADMAERILRDDRLPLQSLEPPRPAQWHFPLEEPVDSAGHLRYAADRLIGRCVERARRESRQVRSIRFVFEGRESAREMVIRPAAPTRSESRLGALFASRLEYLELTEAVRGIAAVGSFCGAVTPQGVLFGEEARRSREAAGKALASLQAERGAAAVQFARVLEDPLPTRRFELRDWTAFPRRRNDTPGDAPEAPGDGSAAGISAPPARVPAALKPDPGGLPPLIRRVALEPGTLNGALRIISRVAYSGGWWERPYSYELAWGESGGRICWLCSDTARGDWSLVGWLD